MRLSRLLAPLALTAALLFGAAPAQGAPEPLLKITSLAAPTNFVPNDATADYTYDIRVANLGAAVTAGTPITIADTLPAGVAFKSASLVLRTDSFGHRHDYGPLPEGVCEVSGQTVTCTLDESIPGAEEPASIYPGEERRLEIAVTPGALGEGETLTNQVSVTGAAPGETDATSAENEASSVPAEAGISSWRALALEEDGSSANKAATHPWQAAFGFSVHTKPAPPGNPAAFVPAGGDL